MENDNHPSYKVLFCVDTLVSNSFSNSSNTAYQLEGRQIANKKSETVCNSLLLLAIRSPR